MQWVTCETMHGSLSRKGEASVRAHCPRSHFLRKMAIPDLCFFLTWLFLSQVQMLLSKAEPTLFTGRLRRKQHVPYYCETSVKGSLFTSMKGWAKGKDLHCGKRWTKNLGVWERPRNSHLGRGFNTMRNAPPSVVDGWSELSGLLGAPLSLWGHTSYNARLRVPALLPFLLKSPWGLKGEEEDLALKSLLLWPDLSSLAEGWLGAATGTVRLVYKVQKKIIFLKICKFLRVQIW